MSPDCQLRLFYALFFFGIAYCYWSGNEDTYGKDD